MAAKNPYHARAPRAHAYLANVHGAAFSTAFRALLEQGLRDDGWPWDWTTLGTLRRPDQRKRGRVVAKSDGIWAGEGLIAATNLLARELGHSGPELVRAKQPDGSRLKRGAVACEWSGPARLVLALERPFLNLAQYASGIATATRAIVDVVEAACPKRTPRVTSTRKILPHYRDLAIYGVLAGGGFSHRVSLAGGVLIKENHVAAAGGVAKAVAGARAAAPHGLKIETEVTSLAELREAIEARADAVLLDNFTPAQVADALAIADRAGDRRPVIEVSGGLSLETAAAYALQGVDLMSFGSLTHSVKVVDLSMLLDR